MPEGFRISEAGDSRISEAGDSRITEGLAIGEASLSATGTLSAISPATRPGESSLSGSGTVSFVGLKDQPGTVNVSGSGTLFAGLTEYNGQAALSGSGALSSAVSTLLAPASFGPAIVPPDTRISEGGDTRITESGDTRVTVYSGTNTGRATLFSDPTKIAFSSVMYMKIGGVWKIVTPYGKHGGSWKQPIQLSRKISGTWKKVY